jgi:NAD(P)H-nitrite reductase large subunit
MVPPLFFRDRHDADAEMIGTRGNRREFLKAAAATASAAAFARPAFSQAAGPRVVVVGGGFSGATCARALRTADPRLVVTLVEPNTTFTASPLSNAVIAGLRDFKLQQFGYDKLAANGITLAFSAATSFDPPAKTLKLDNGTTLAYDRLVLAPGIDLRWNALRPGGGGANSACVERCRSDSAAAQAARSDGRRRHRRGVRACQSCPLPARAL